MYGTPVRRTTRPKSQKHGLSGILGLLCAEQTSEISKNGLSGIIGLLCADRNVGNLKNGLSGIMGILRAEQDVGNLNTWTFRNSGTPVRRTRRRKSQKMHFQELWDAFAQNKTSEISKMDFQQFWDSCAQNKTSEISKMDFQQFWDSCVENKTSEISTIALSGILGLLCAGQDVGNPNIKCTFGNSGTPARRTKRQKSKHMHFQVFWDSCAQNKTSEISKNALSAIWDSCA